MSLLGQQPFIAELERLAHSAQREELTFRDSIAREITRRERERQFAFRRVELARSMARVAAGAQSEKVAIARQLDALVGECGWYGESDQRRKTLEAWTPVAIAVWQGVQPTTASPAEGHAAATDPVAVHHAMCAFEAWYELEFGQPFLAILDYEIPEIPVVEF